MNKHAVYHMPDVPYAYAKDKDTLTVRIRTASKDIKECKIYYKCRYDWVSPFEVKNMKLVGEGELFSFYEVDLNVSKNRYRYYFELTDLNGISIYYDERGFREKLIEKNEATAFQFAYISEVDVYYESNWLQESVVYQIFPDRFCNGDKRNDPENTLPWGSEVSIKSMFGGDLQGIINQLDYLEDLGINLLYLTPIFKSISNHKYNTADYYDVDPSFGTLEDAKALVKKCHERGIRIVFDAVFNHSGSDFFAFEDVLKNQERSKYKDWYFLEGFPVSIDNINYYTFANEVAQMPKFNTNNPEVREYLLKVGEYWIKEIGIDGWRLDVSDEVDHSFWKDFRKVVKTANKDAVIIGEIMHESSPFLRGDEMDCIMNYPFKGAMVDFFAARRINETQFENILTMNRVLYMNSVTRQMWNLLGSHDTSRFLTECGEDERRLKLAAAFQFTYIGVPYIYYGDEVGMVGGHDPLCRACMVWESEKQNTELLQLFKKLIAIRKEYETLTYGDYESLYAKDNLIVFERKYRGERIVSAINNSEDVRKISIDLGEDAVDLITGEKVSIIKGLELKPMEFRILKRI